MNSIYCSPAQIKILMGESDGKAIHLDNYAVANTPEGAMINGIVTDEDAMTTCLAKLAGDYVLDKGENHLVITGNNILTKTMDVPAVSEQQIMEFIQREFSQYGSEEGEAEKLYDYTVLNPQAESGGSTILAVAVSKGLIESYRTIFLGAGIDLKGINVGTNALIKLTHFTPELREGTYVIAQVDGQDLTLTLFNEGQYSLTNRYKLLNFTGTPEWQNEIGDNLSSMIQFNKGQKGTVDIKTVYITGILPGEIESLREMLSYLDIEITALDLTGIVIPSDTVTAKGEFSTGGFLYNIGNLLRK